MRPLILQAAPPDYLRNFIHLIKRIFLCSHGASKNKRDKLRKSSTFNDISVFSLVEHSDEVNLLKTPRSIELVKILNYNGEAIATVLASRFTDAIFLEMFDKSESSILESVVEETPRQAPKQKVYR